MFGCFDCLVCWDFVVSGGLVWLLFWFLGVVMWVGFVDCSRIWVGYGFGACCYFLLLVAVWLVWWICVCVLLVFGLCWLVGGLF